MVRTFGCERRGRWVQIPPVTCFMVVVQWENDGLQNRRSGFDSLLPCAERFKTPSVDADIVQFGRTSGSHPENTGSIPVIRFMPYGVRVAQLSLEQLVLVRLQIGQLCDTSALHACSTQKVC